MKKISSLKIFEKFLCLGVSHVPQNLEILSNFSSFGILILMYFDQILVVLAY